MANTKQSAKRAKQNLTRQAINIRNKSTTKTAVKAAVTAIQNKASHQDAKAALMNAIKSLAKAGSKGAIPKKRASRKISRLTKLAQKTNPSILG